MKSLVRYRKSEPKPVKRAETKPNQLGYFGSARPLSLCKKIGNKATSLCCQPVPKARPAKDKDNIAATVQQHGVYSAASGKEL